MIPLKISDSGSLAQVTHYLRIHPSDWSSVRCLKCRRYWRTKAEYVEKLPSCKDGE